MEDTEKLKRIKERCLGEIREQLPIVRSVLDGIDGRLCEYIADAVREDMDTANVYELLGIRKELRLLYSYELNGQMVQKVLRAIEGTWREGKHIAGGLKFDTPRGAKHVRLMPYQVWCIFGIYGFLTDVSMERKYVEGMDLLPSEFVSQDDTVWDKRRLCSEAHIFQTRKSGKTEFGGALDFVEANVLGPQNAQVLICANSKDQAKIAYKAIKTFCFQLDPKATNKAGGKYLRVTADEAGWLPGLSRTAEIKVMSAGGKKKDGLYASWVHPDEHGSASYVKDHSDMEDLVQVCVGSMGPRREKMVLHTTTAGLVNEGPYQIQLRVVENTLLREMDFPLGEAHRTTDDKWFAFLLRLDPWEITDNLEDLNKPNLWRKVNRSIGTTVQPNWYRERIHDAITKGEDVKKEVLTKDFNIWQTSRHQEWVSPDAIRALQTDMRIDDCTDEEGWQVFVGLDFSMGDDLHAVSYLAFRDNDEGGRDFFADMDAWISSETLASSPVKELYKLWIEQGWLHVSPGATLQPELPADRIAELYDKGVTFLGFGYDPYKAKAPVNAIGSWIVSLTGDLDAMKNYIMPVRQNYASYNPVVEEMDFMLKNDPALITFSMNPMWPWEFGNVVLDVSADGMENKKPVKANHSEGCKVDNIQCLCSALILYDLADSRKN